MNIFKTIKAKLDPSDDIWLVQVGWYYQVQSINRAKGEVTLSVAKATYANVDWWSRLCGRKPQRVIVV